MIKSKIRYSKVKKFALGTSGAGEMGGGETGGTAGAGGGKYAKLLSYLPMVANAGGTYLENDAYHSDGRVSRDKYALGQSVKGAGQGAEIGSQFGTKGALVGAGVGAIYGGIKGSLEGKDINTEVDAQELLAKQEKDRFDKATQLAEDNQRMNYSKAYLASNPALGQTGASVYAYGTNMNGRAIPKKAMGGQLNPLASDIEKAEGASHEQGGITLHDNNGQPKAEIEGEEVVVDDKQVLSDRLSFTGNKSFAQVGEELGKEKGKNEEKLKTGDMFARNGAKRTIDGINKKMDILLKYQDVVRTNEGLDDASPVNQMKYGTNLSKYAFGTPPYQDEDNAISLDENGNPRINKYNSFEPTPNLNMKGLTIPEAELKGNTNLKEVPMGYSKPVINKRQFDSGDFSKTAENLAPYLDNIVNAQLIKQTPNIPNPTKRAAINEMAMPLNTTYNINANLAANNQDLKEYNKNILDNTSNSNNARASVASGFAKKLKMNNDIYAQKINAENQLKDRNALNTQAVNNRNINNRQDIDNQNNQLTDKYNWDNMLRKDDIRGQKSILAAETTNDLTTGIQDKRRGELDNKKIFYDSLKYDDASGFASLIGTDEMKTLMKDPKIKKQVYDSLKKGGQTKAEKQARELYGE